VIAPLLAATEPEAFALVNAAGSSNLVLVCDHASNRIPRQLGSLGLTEQKLKTHIAWDVGALAVAHRLSKQLDAPLVFGNYSRLVIDCNRHPESQDSIVQASAGIAVPGNRGLSNTEARRRRECLFDPYHQAIDMLLLARRSSSPFLLSIHSFTPVLQGLERPWPIGVCYEEANGISERWVAVLQASSGVNVGDNQPFTVEADVDFTIPTIVKSMVYRRS
jgi:predicted N-formylglutamate amidohydrolase